MQTTEHLLDADQEIELARRVEAGVYATHLLATGDRRPGLAEVAEEGRQAWQRLWLANTGMVVLLARRYGRGQRDIEDELIQEGYLALAQALMRYDWARGLRLSTQAWHWVRHHLAQVMRGRSRWERATRPGEEALHALEVGAACPAPEVSAELRGLLAPLTTVERQVLLARANGDRWVDIAAQLGLGMQVVRGIERRAVTRVRRVQLADVTGSAA